MRSEIIASLRSRLPQIRARWERLLGSSRLMSPPNPAQLAFMIEWACDAVFTELGHGPAAGRRTNAVPGTRCERNPFGRYFAAGEAAFALALAPKPPQAVDAAAHEVARAFTTVSSREVAAYCTVCPRQSTCALHQACAA